MRFDRAYCPSPLCAPSRACLAQGRRYGRTGVWSNGNDNPDGIATFYQGLRDAGYRVGSIGKGDLRKAAYDWGPDGFHRKGAHNYFREWGFTDGFDSEGKLDVVIGFQKEQAKGGPHPDRQNPYLRMLAERRDGSLDTYLGWYKEMRDKSKHPNGGYSYTTPCPLADPAYNDNWVGANALSLIKNELATDRPWFLQVNFPGPHNPLDITPPMAPWYRDASFPPPVKNDQLTPAIHQEIRRNYSAMVENVDHWLGKFLEALDRRGETSRTLVVFSSDHGEMLGDHNRWAKTLPYQPSVSVPLIVRGPGVRSGSVHHRPAATLDLPATFLELAGAPVPGDMDSQSLVPVLAGAAGAGRSHVTSALGSWRMVCDERFKLVRGFDPSNPGGGEGGTHFPAPRDQPVLLFDLDGRPHGAGQSRGAPSRKWSRAWTRCCRRFLTGVVSPMKSPLRVAAALVTLSAAAIPAHADSPTGASRPNIILAMADDMGWGDVGFNGNKIIQTPNLDAMAAASLRFDRFYSAAPVCSPTRGGCLTGRHPYRYGIWTANAGHLRKEEISLAEALKTQGYVTGHFGKWHLGTLSKGNDGRRGGNGDNRDYSPPWQHGSALRFSTEQAVPTRDPLVKQPFPTQYWTGPGQAATDNLAGDDSRVIMDRALPFIRKAAADKTPFLAVIWFHAPHEPVVAGPEFRRIYSDRSEGEQNYYGAITALDVQMGRLRKELRALGVADNTLVWFASDNGPEGNTGDTGTTRGSAGPFRGRKRSLWEGGIHEPGLLEWPARIKPGTVTTIPCSTLDYFPTTLDLLGFRMHGQPEPIDGVSLVPLFDGTMKERPVPIPFETLGGTGTNASRGSPRMALVDNRFKFLTDMAGPKDKDLLFDLIKDPGETTNLAETYPDVTAAMKQKLVEFRASYKRSLAGKDYAAPFTPTKYDIPPSEPGFARESLRGGEGKAPAPGGPDGAEKNCPAG